MYLLRHGATSANLQIPPILQGCGTDLPLSEEGRDQARRAAEALKWQDLAAVYSSPLLRGVETAEAIALACGVQAMRVPEITECDVGQWEGRDWEEIARTDPEAFRLFRLDAGVNPYLGGENLSQVLARVTPALARLADAHVGQSIAVVAHNVVNRTYLASLWKLPLAHYRSISQHNCGINVIDYHGSRAQCVTVNMAMHLRDW
jgi:broad specificity phosphatase PhoE